MRLSGKVALVTGGANGLGEAICRRLAEEGATVVVSDIDAISGQNLVEQINASAGKAVFKQQDVVDELRWREIVGEIVAEYGALDVLVNNAGIGIPRTVEEETLEGWRKTQSINLDAVFLGTQAAIAVMKERGGSIINMSSIEGIVGEPLTAAYNASKGGVRIFTKSAALHCANQGYPVRINSVHPGFVATALVEGGMEVLGKERAEAFSSRILGNIPMQRLAEPVEIANGVLFLASDEASYMTGSELIIDGGYTAR